MTNRIRALTVAARDYQIDAVRSTIAALRLKKNRSALVVMPTGTGKSLVAAEVAAEFVRRGSRVLVLAHMTELVEQLSESLEIDTGMVVGVEMAEKAPRPHQRIVVGSVQTLKGKRLARFAFDPGLVIVDEAHHATAASYRKILARFPRAKVVGLTATPNRADGKGLGDIFDCVPFNYSIRDAIDAGWHARPKLKIVTVEGLNLDAVRARGADLDEGDLSAVMVQKANLHGVVTPALKLAEARPTLVFAVTVAHAQALCRVFNDARPGCARVIHGETPRDEQKAAIKGLEAGKFQFLVNCALLGEGINIPAASCIVMARPTRSASRYLQAIGRAARLDPEKAPGKSDMLVLDFAATDPGEHFIVDAIDALAGKEATAEQRGRAREAVEAQGGDIIAALDEAARMIAEDRAAGRLPDPKWTAEDRSLFIASIDWAAQPWETESDRRIAMRLGVSQWSVTRRRPPDVPTPAARKTGIDWSAQPWARESNRQIAKRVGVDKATAAAHRPLETNHPRRDRMVATTQIDWSTIEWTSKSNAKIATETGAHHSTVAKRRPPECPSPATSTEYLVSMAARIRPANRTHNELSESARKAWATKRAKAAIGSGARQP